MAITHFLNVDERCVAGPPDFMPPACERFTPIPAGAADAGTTEAAVSP